MAHSVRIAYVLPTRNRHDRLWHTLASIEALGPHDAEVIVVDNASDTLPRTPHALETGVPVQVIPLMENLGAAARNLGVIASDPGAEWIVMLDDDSAPRDARFLSVLASQPRDVAAVSADIFLPAHRGQGKQVPREAGGLPEVFIGCGVALRREVFIRLQGYDPAFNYYAEEYDLAARMLLAGYRVVFDRSFIVDHLKVSAGRDMNVILERLIRNNGWVAQRYAPQRRRREELRELRRRYRRIAIKEGAIDGFARGLIELRRTLRSQGRTPMTAPIDDRFTGLAHAREALQAAHAARPFASAAIVDEGKNAWAVRRALGELGVTLVSDADAAEVRVIGTMSPGPMLDSAERRAGAPGPRVVAPWRIAADVINELQRSSRTGSAA